MSKLHWWAFQPTHGRQPAAAQLQEPLSRRTSEGRLREWQTAVVHRHGQRADCSSAQARAEKAFLVNGNAIVPWFFEDGPRAVWMAPSFFLLCAYVALLDVAHSTRRSCVQQKRC
jgi:hypothetical protein